MRYLKALERCFERCNLIGENVDIWEQMMRYKVLREAPEAIQEATYMAIASRLGLLNAFWYKEDKK